MNYQPALTLFESTAESKIFRPIHYLGSKFRMLDFIEETIGGIDTKGRVCDLFAGSGTVSYRLSRNRPVTSVDIQEYCKVIGSAILNPNSDVFPLSNFMDECENSSFSKNILWAIEPLIDFEKYALQKANLGDLEPLCNLLEHGSIVTYEISGFLGKCSYLSESIKNTIARFNSLNLLNNVDLMCVRHFGGLYFSFLQTAQIDILLHAIHKQNLKNTSPFLAAVLSTVSNAVNTVGKQFAQPLKPRGVGGTPKNNLLKKIQKDRGIDIFKEFEFWMYKYQSVEKTSFDHSILKMDYSDALEILPSDTTIVYADPPYTRDHYSRFYHALETICLRDNPELSTTKLNGINQISRGIYRQHRYQSPFCIKSQAPIAFENLFSKVKNKKLSLVLSYSQFDKSKNSHPRLLTMTNLLFLAKKYFNTVEVLSPGGFTHSKLNHADKHLEASSFAETLIICK